MIKKSMRNLCPNFNPPFKAWGRNTPTSCMGLPTANWLHKVPSRGGLWFEKWLWFQKGHFFPTLGRVLQRGLSYKGVYYFIPPYILSQCRVDYEITNYVFSLKQRIKFFLFSHCHSPCKPATNCKSSDWLMHQWTCQWIVTLSACHTMWCNLIFYFYRCVFLLICEPTGLESGDWGLRSGLGPKLRAGLPTPTPMGFQSVPK